MQELASSCTSPVTRHYNFHSCIICVAFVIFCSQYLVCVCGECGALLKGPGLPPLPSLLPTFSAMPTGLW